MFYHYPKYMIMGIYMISGQSAEAVLEQYDIFFIYQTKPTCVMLINKMQTEHCAIEAAIIRLHNYVKR